MQAVPRRMSMLIRFKSGHVDTMTIRDLCDRLALGGHDTLLPEQLVQLATDVGRLCDMIEAQTKELAFTRRLLSDACECLATGSEEEECVLAEAISRSLEGWMSPGAAEVRKESKAECLPQATIQAVSMAADTLCAGPAHTLNGRSVSVVPRGRGGPAATRKISPAFWRRR